MLRRAAGAAVLVGLLLAGWFVFDVTGDDDGCSDFRFDAAAWAGDSDPSAWGDASRSGEPTIRQRLADRLIECGTLAGRRRAELNRMLGRPDGGIAHGEDASTWTTGVERGYIHIDNEHLLVRFGADGRATSARLVTD